MFYREQNAIWNGLLMSSKAKFLDSYKMRLVNEFKLSLLYFSLLHAVTLEEVFTLIVATILIAMGKTGKCFFY